jgi:adenylate cyclase class 2
MAHEIETKILNVDKNFILQKMLKLGAQKLQETRLVVDWFRTANSGEGGDPWYLRIRSYSDGKSEITWKGKSDVLGASRKHKEINFTVSSHELAEDFLHELGLEKYAHQEKDRISWAYQNWRFDLDQYPGMPAYLEIEGQSENHIQDAIKLLELGTNKSSSEGERILIQNEYSLDWYNMKF